MATVVNRGAALPVVDPKLCTWNRSGNAPPSSAPLYVGEIWYDNLAGKLYRGIGLGAADWQAVTELLQ